MDYKDILVKHLINWTYEHHFICYINPHYVFTIENSIHYQALVTNDYTRYRRLVKDQPEHSEEIFTNLQQNFDINKIGKIQLEWNEMLQKYLVNDGCHRLSIMKHRNIELKEEYLCKT